MIKALVFAAILSVILIGETPNADEPRGLADDAAQIATDDDTEGRRPDAQSSIADPRTSEVQLTMTTSIGYFQLPGRDERHRFEITPVGSVSASSVAASAAMMDGSNRQHAR